MSCNIRTLSRFYAEEILKLRTIHAAYARQTEIEGLSKYSRPKDEEINLLSREIFLIKNTQQIK